MKKGLTDNRDLIRDAAGGDEEAFAALVRRHQDDVARLVLRVTRRPDLVEDVAQEVFLKVYRNLSGFKRKAGFRTWLYRVAVNASLDALRSDKSCRRIEAPGDGPSSLPDHVLVGSALHGRVSLDLDLQLDLERALAELRPADRAILALRYFEELSTPEIARVLDIPEGTARSRLHYARAELARQMKPYRARARARGAETEK